MRAVIRRLRDKFAGRLSGVLVEPMITGGIETIIGLVQKPVFGPVVVFGLGGVATEVLGDHAARLARLTSGALGATASSSDTGCAQQRGWERSWNNSASACAGPPARRTSAGCRSTRCI